MKYKSMRIGKIIKLIKKEIQPSEQFVKQARERFLALYEGEFLPVQTNLQAHHSPWKVYLMRAASVTAAIVVIAGTTAAYADQKNVSAQSPLYPLKRVGESIRLAVSANEKKQEVRTELAIRRVEEFEKDDGIPEASRNEIAISANTQLKISLKELPKSEKQEKKEDDGKNAKEREESEVALKQASPEREEQDMRVSLFSAPAAIDGTTSSPVVSPTTTSSQSPELQTETKTEIEVERKEKKEDGKKKLCDAVEKTIGNADTWVRVGDKELEELFEEKCE